MKPTVNNSVFQTKITPIKPLNEEFTLAQCRVMALGKNRNFSHFSKEAVDEALPTLANIPVIAHVFADDEGKLRIGGHDMEIVSEDGTFKFKSTCIPYGTVPEANNAHYEEVEEADGTKATYLVCDIILWNRFEDLMKTIYSEDVYWNHSMEINPDDVKPLKDDKNYQDVLKFAFSALCLLNKGDSESDPNNVTPCFPSSDVQPYKFEFDEKFYELADQLKSELALCFSQQSSEKGGKIIMDIEKIESILTEFNLTREVLDFEISEEMTEDELRTKVQEFVANQNSNDNGADNGSDGSEPKVESFSATYRTKQDAINSALPSICERDENGKCIKEVYFYLVDFDDNFAYVEKNTWVPGDYSQEKGRIKYTFDENTSTAECSDDFELMIVKWLTLEENQQIEANRAEFERLQNFEKDTIEAQHKAEMEAVFEKFENLSSVEEFINLKKDYSAFATVEALEEKCFAIKGKHNIVKSDKPKKVLAGVSFGANHNSDKDELDEFMEKYSKKN